MKIAASGMWLVCAACACACSGDDKSTNSPAHQPTAPAATPATAPGAQTDPRARDARLCVTPDRLEVEPFDLEALEDESLAPDVPADVTRTLDAAAAAGPVMELAGGAGFVAPLFRCSAATCVLGVATLDARGRETGIEPLPAAGVPDAATQVRLSAARADVNSDGQDELWVGWQVGDPETQATSQHLAALTWPALELIWHGRISLGAQVATEPGCDGALYPVDADCDGDGDLVLIERCGPMRCLNDDSEGCPPPAERVAVFLWDAPAKRYRELAAPAP